MDVLELQESGNRARARHKGAAGYVPSDVLSNSENRRNHQLKCVIRKGLIEIRYSFTRHYESIEQ
jgi:hypothetical protein